MRNLGIIIRGGSEEVNALIFYRIRGEVDTSSGRRKFVSSIYIYYLYSEI
jgi:hypothetical protein